MLPVEQIIAFAQLQPAVGLVSVVLGALLGARVLLTTLTRKKTKAFVYPQPASTLPILGNTFDALIFHNSRIYDWFSDHCLVFDRPWLLLALGTVPTITISTSELFEDVMKTQFDVFPKGEDETEYYSDLFGKGILASDGDVWYFHRKTASNLFSNQMIRDVMYEALREKIKTLCDTLRTYETRNEAPSFRNVITQFTSDVFGKVGFGVDLNCLENNLAGKPGNEFIGAFTVATKILGERFQQPKWFWQQKRQLNIGSEKVLAHNVEVINKFIFRIINESVAKKNSECEGSSNTPITPMSSKDLISLFLNSNIKEEENVKGKAFDSEMHLIRDMVVSFIFAGKDTTSHSMSWFIVMINRYPVVLERVRAELKEKLPGFASSETMVPSLDDLSQLTYLEAAIRENLRLNPVLPISARQANKDTVLCDGTPIPKDTRVAIGMYASARKTSIWGEDALEFKPERWIDPETEKLLVVSPFKSMFFFGGPRQCIGMKFAMMELKCTLAVLLSKFDLETVEDPWTITYEVALTMAVKGQLLVKVTSLVGGSTSEVAPSA